MEREAMLLVLALAVCGPLCVGFGVIAPTAPRFGRSGRRAEALAWWRLWLPLVPASLALAVLCGWALQEGDDTGDALALELLVAAVPGAIIAARAIARALVSAWPARVPLVATVGLVRPRIVIDPALAAALPADALDAVRAHELAHARHRDPLRIWLAQIATDLQWPAPSARVRFHQWLHTLEVARDEEAREAGACGDALAAAILAVARLAQRRSGACATLTGHGELLRDRIARLLRPTPATRKSRRALWLLLAVVVLVAGGVSFGVARGDAALDWVPGVFLNYE